MNWLKLNSLIGTVLFLAMLLLGAEVWLWWTGRETALRALAALEQMKSELDSLAHHSPALSRENEQAIAGDLANTRKVIAALRSSLQDEDAAIRCPPPPEKSIDLYVDIAAFVERTRAQATRAGIAIRKDECFGFASQAHEGPAAELIPAVHRQRVVGQYLIEALFESRPRSLLAVQRQRPHATARRTRQDQPSPPGAASPQDPVGQGDAVDFFEFAKELSVGIPSMMDTDAFRMEFTGQTPVLREFLNRLAVLELPANVRSVRVEPLRPEEAPANSTTDAPAALVGENISRFTVVVEVIAPPAESGEPAL